MEIDKIIIVTRLTRLEENVKRFNTKAQASFFVKKRGQSFEDYEVEDDHYRHARDVVVKAIPPGIKFQIIDRNFLPNFLFGPKDAIITLGQDGLVVNVAKYLNGQTIIAINPDPERFDGILLPFRENEALGAIDSLLGDKFNIRNVSMARVDMNDGQKLYAFNDLFIGPSSHISARYTIHYGKKIERQMSSGIIVSTPAGSTGWISSLFNMANGISHFQGKKNIIKNKSMGWEEKKLTFVVREPFRSQWSGVEIVAGEVSGDQELILESHMAEKGVIFSDGMESDFMEFNSGATARIHLAEKTTKLLMNNNTPAGTVAK